MAHRQAVKSEMPSPRSVTNSSLWRIILFSIGIAALSTSQAPPATAQQAQASGSIISRARIDEIRNRAMLGPDLDVSELAHFFGIAAEGASFLVRQAGFTTRSTRIMHYFTFAMDGSGRSFIARTLEVDENDVTMARSRPIELWLCDSDGNLLGAAVLIHGAYQRRPVESARPDFEAEMQLWARVNNFAPSAPTANH